MSIPWSPRAEWVGARDGPKDGRRALAFVSLLSAPVSAEQHLNFPGPLWVREERAPGYAHRLDDGDAVRRAVCSAALGDG